MNGLEIKDAFRFVLVEIFAGTGFDPEMMLFRLQSAIAIIGSPPFDFPTFTFLTFTFF